MDKKTSKLKPPSIYKTDSNSIFVISAPSGTGKTTLCQALVEYFPTIKYTVSCTTRRKREGEMNNLHYHFLSKDKFIEKIKQEKFAEWAEVHGNLYGTLKHDIVELNRHGFDVLMDIDTQGAMQIKNAFPHSILIFILPPSIAELKQRLLKRQTDSEEEISGRIQKVHDEVQALYNFDYLVINDIFDKALEVLKAIVISNKTKIDNVNRKWVEYFFEGF